VETKCEIASPCTHVHMYSHRRLQEVTCTPSRTADNYWVWWKVWIAVRKHRTSTPFV